MRIGMALAAALILNGIRPAMAKDYTVTVSAPNRSYREAPVTFMMDIPRDFVGFALFEKNVPVPVQTRLVDGRAEVTFLVQNLQRFEKRRYKLTYERVGRPVSESGVIIDRNGGNLDVRINNELFTRYDTTTGPNKPYFYPLNGPDGKRISRGYPLESIPGETSKDHPHHRGLWFTHGEVNGEDFWSEEKRAAKTVPKGFTSVQRGAIYGFFEAKAEWIATNGKKVLDDTRQVTIYNTGEGRLMDFDIALKAEGPVVFGDTKEGSLGIRLADSMRLAGGGGHIVNSAGIKDGLTWGKRAEWVDYFGPVGGETVGIAILDHPDNLRHPTYWHVRDYGLFAANPFGVHDFTNDKQHPHIGDHTLAADGTLRFRYRIYLHRGTTEEAHVADVWGAYMDPPAVDVR